jgi:AcrR family transcriptional regulator
MDRMHKDAPTDPTRTSARRGGAPAQERELRAQGKETMRKLLDAGMKVFGRRGYHAARVDDIVKVARTSHGTFYLYFSNKDDLLQTLMHDCVEEMEQLADELPAIAPDESGRAALRDWLGRFADRYRHYGPVVRAWTEAETAGTTFGHRGQEVLGEFAGKLAVRIGEADPDRVDPTIGALAFVAMIERFNYFVITRQIEFDRDTVLDTLSGILHLGLFAGTRTGEAPG